MFFKVSLYSVLVLFGIGLGYKVQSWFRCPVGSRAGGIPVSQRVWSAITGLGRTLFSPQFVPLLKVFLMDVLFQRRLFKESLPRWLAHSSLSFGFLFLLLMHALDRFLTRRLFAEYAATINPFLFLRNFFGALVLAGLVFYMIRRLRNPIMRMTTRSGDIYALGMLFLIVLSGIALEASKIVSHQRYQEMVVENASLSGEEEARALRAYWAREFAVVFPEPPVPDAETLKKGRELHVYNCASCHSKPTAAFLSYPLAKAFRPWALVLGQDNVRSFLRVFHFLLCFIGLAFLPVSKFFHVLTSPLILLINGVMDRSRALPANIATVQAIELEACTHCATCTQHCSVRPIFRHIPNWTILPSEKLSAYRSLVLGKKATPDKFSLFQEGASICTGCYRGTSFCPVGIVAQELWFCMREDLLHMGCPDLFVSTRDTYLSRFGWDKTKVIIPMTSKGKAFKKEVHHSFQGSSFDACFTCMTCSNACPVVVHYEKPMEKLGLLPHQIMQSLKYGLQDNVLGARMVWDCLGCYHCQENCPQEIKVTDILFELKSIAFQKMKKLKAES